MKYPKCNRNAAYSVSVPALSGGVNLSNGVNFAADNQLTDCKNLYWKDGALRTRPGFQLQNTVNVTTAKEPLINATMEWNGKNVRCIANRLTDTDGRFQVHITFFTADGGIRSTAPITLSPEDRPESLLVVSGPSTKGEGVYAFIGLEQGGLVYELDDNLWERITESDVYAPLVLVNGKGNLYSEALNEIGAEAIEAAPASLFEGFNTLFGRFRASFFTDGKSTVFQLPGGALADEDIEIQFMQSRHFHLTIQAGQTESEPAPMLAFAFAKVDREKGTISFLHRVGDLLVPFALPLTENVSNSLVVTASLPVNTGGKLGAPLRMKQSVWFGGSSLGGGSRLFLTGDPQAPGIVRWSDCASPLYFPENNYARVGGPEAVTAMAKQDNLLVFFKPSEIYATALVDGNSYTPEDLLAGTVADATAVAATFPITQLHPTIGCDRPDTIQLCDNRLVFARSDGGIYTLVSANAYSENNVYCLSHPVKAAMPKSEMFSADWDGYYLLFSAVDPRIIVMDYRSYGFRYVSSYARHKTEAPFFLWENPATGCFTAVSGPDGLSVIRRETGKGTGYSNFLLTGQTDRLGAEGSPLLPIEASFRTKLFDFGRPQRYKRILSLHLGAGGNGEMELFFLSERGETPALGRKALHTDKRPGDPGYIQTMSMSAAARVRQFGVGVRASGIAAFDGIGIQYKILR
ncbi:MAG: hypothetical protein HFE86_02100 [Clostridiales bacterium]|nr:hypothetical protein [Clostridiales bacterium]